MHKYVVASNELHELYAGPADRFHEVFDLDDGVLKLLQEEIDERGRTPLHILAGNAQAYTHVLAEVGVQSICFNDEALTKQDNKGETPIDIARRSGACAEIIGLLSLTPEEAYSLDLKGMARLYAPVAYWQDEMVIWFKSRSWVDCHKFINEHDDELVREVLKYINLPKYVHSEAWGWGWTNIRRG